MYEETLPHAFAEEDQAEWVRTGRAKVLWLCFSLVYGLFSFAPPLKRSHDSFFFFSGDSGDSGDSGFRAGRFLDCAGCVLFDRLIVVRS